MGPANTRRAAGNAKGRRIPWRPPFRSDPQAEKRLKKKAGSGNAKARFTPYGAPIIGSLSQGFTGSQTSNGGAAPNAPTSPVNGGGGTNGTKAPPTPPGGETR